MRLARGILVVVLTILTASGLAGCSWLLGVADDPVVVGDAGDASDEEGGDEDADPGASPEAGWRRDR